MDTLGEPNTQLPAYRTGRVLVGAFTTAGGGVGRSAVCGLLAHGLADARSRGVLLSQDAGLAAGPVTIGPSVLVDLAPAGSPGWQRLVAAIRSASAGQGGQRGRHAASADAVSGTSLSSALGSGPQVAGAGMDDPDRPSGALDVLVPCRWQAARPGPAAEAAGRRRAPEPGPRPPVVVATDETGRLRPWWVGDVLADVAGGGPARLLELAGDVVVDSGSASAEQSTAQWWARHRDGEPSAVARWLQASPSFITSDRLVTAPVAVLVVPATADGYGQALALVTDLEGTGVNCDRLVVAAVEERGGVPRTAKPRRELLRGRVHTVVDVPWVQQVHDSGPWGWADSKADPKAVARAAALVDAVLAVAAAACAAPSGGHQSRTVTSPARTTPVAAMPAAPAQGAGQPPPPSTSVLPVPDGHPYEDLLSA